MKKLRAIFKRKMGHRLFWSVLVTYLLLLAVTLLLLAGGYSYSIQRARQDAETMEISFLGQVRQELDIRLNSVSRISNFLAAYPLTQSISQIREEQASYLLDYRALDEIIVEQNALLSGDGSTIVYFDASDSVLTGTYRYRSENLEAYTQQLGFTPEEFREFLPEKVTNGELRILHPGTAEAELIYMIPVLNDEYKKVGTVLTRFSMSYLKKSINADHWTDGTICCMQNDSEFLYLDNGGYEDTVIHSDALDYESVPLNASPIAITINGEKYLTVGRRSSVNRWNYYFSIPLKELTRTNTIYTVLFAVILCLSIFSGVVMSLYFSRRLSDPIQGIMDSLKLDSAVAFPKAVSSLETAMISYRKETVRNETHRSIRQKKDGFVYGLCSGRVASDQLDAGKEKFGLSLNQGPVSLIVFQFYAVDDAVFIQDGHLDQEMMLYAGCNVIEELLCQGRGAAIAHEKEVLCLYQPETQVDEEALRATLMEIYDFHKNVLHIGLRIYFTGFGECLADLPELLSVAEEMSRYKVFWGDDVPDILIYCEISDMGGMDTADALGAEKRFLNLLAIENYEEAYQLLMEQLDSGVSRDLRRFQQERYRIHGFISNLLANLQTSMSERNMEELGDLLNSLLAEKSLSGLREKVDLIFRHIIVAQQEKSQLAGAPSWVQEVQDYIEEHYADPQMDVTHLAKVFSLNISHLSRTYKKITSIGVLDNIHMMRITKAKELLDRGCTVQEASAQVGYLESRALIRAFKRYEGITPGQYQEINLKKKA